jgi:hypothetical protein
MTCAAAPVGCGATGLTVTVLVNYGQGVAFRLCRRCWSETTAPPKPRVEKGRRK